MRLVTIASRTTSAEAHVIRAKLETEGVRAVVNDEMTVLIRWDLSNAIGGVKVQIAEEDVERALDVLDAASAAWSCAVCGETVNDDFPTCWSCGASREGEAGSDQAETGQMDATPPAKGESVASPEPTINASAESVPPVETRREESDNPFRPPFERESAAPLEEQALQETDTSEGDDVALRAWRAAAFILYEFPPLFCFCSVCLLLKLSLSELPLSRKGKIRYRLAWLINLALAAVVGVHGLYLYLW